MTKTFEESMTRYAKCNNCGHNYPLHLYEFFTTSGRSCPVCGKIISFEFDKLKGNKGETNATIK